MRETNLAERKVSAFSLVDKFIEFSSNSEEAFEPCLNATNQKAQTMLFEAVSALARHSGQSLGEAYDKVVGYIAVQKEVPRETLMRQAPPVLESALRKVGYRCGLPVPGWGCSKK